MDFFDDNDNYLSDLDEQSLNNNIYNNDYDFDEPTLNEAYKRKASKLASMTSHASHRESRKGVGPVSTINHVIKEHDETCKKNTKPKKIKKTIKSSNNDIIDELLNNVKISSNSDSDSEEDENDEDEEEEDENDEEELSPEENKKIRKKYDKLLKKYWGFDSLKDTQFRIIKEIIINRRNVCAVLATGFGKSICYQLPQLINKKCVIVICPLIALMNEQYLDMKEKGLDVCVFNSETTSEDLKKERKEIYDGKGKIIYMTPENILKCESFIKKIEDKLEMVAIDEAHAISTWGLDFRKSYRNLSVLKEWIPNVPILTLTATASTRVRKDIVDILGLKRHKLIMGNFDRPNLIIRVFKKIKPFPQEMTMFIQKYKDEYMIIYCNSRDKTDEVSEKIRLMGISCNSYHAGMSDEMRTSVQNKFIKGTVKCMVATIAFGMGINIPSVRLVLHYNCPKNIESYYQEIGRAGRDGEISECVLLYAARDFATNRYFIKSMANGEQKKYQELQIKKIEKYVGSNDCRRKLILENFGQNMESCTRCDNCIDEKKKNEFLINYTKETYLILSILNKIDGKYGIGTSISILLGRKAKLKDFMFEFEEYSTGTAFGNEQFWKDLYRHLISDDYIEEKQDGFYITIGLAPKGTIFINKLSEKYVILDQLVEDFDNLDKSFVVMYPQIESLNKVVKRAQRSATSVSTTEKKNYKKNDEKEIVKKPTRYKK